MASAYDRRNARARAAGFKNYYEQRIRGGVEQARPSTPRPEGEELSRMRGHRGPADLEQLLASGRVEMVTAIAPSGGRDDKGRWRAIDWRITLDDGSDKDFTIRASITPEQLNRLRDAIRDQGILYLPRPSVDVFRLFAESDEEDEDEYDLEAGDLEEAG